MHEKTDSTQRWCHNNLYKFLEKDQWPANSPDLNPLDFYFWNAVVSKMEVKVEFTLEDLKEEIKRAFKKVNKEEIKKSVLSFNKRVRDFERADGEYCHN